jgi:hypothetical protein
MSIMRVAGGGARVDACLGCRASRDPACPRDAIHMAVVGAAAPAEHSDVRKAPEQFGIVGPCLICGRTPAHVHHIRYAQSRGLALKVSDEFTVTLCAIHHSEIMRQATKDGGGRSARSTRSLLRARFGAKAMALGVNRKKLQPISVAETHTAV